MKDGPEISLVSALIGDPARANMLTALMSGQALAASELAREGGVTSQTASGHLVRMLDAGLLSVERQGRHRYYRLAGPDVATALESLMTLASQSLGRRARRGPKDPEMRRARVCYDHLAGERGIELFQRLCEQEVVILARGQIDVTPTGAKRLGTFGIDVGQLQIAKRPLCRSCIDWSERVPHLAGAVGAALLARMVEIGWAKRIAHTRIVRFSAVGDDAFSKLFLEDMP
jgi:DNA-binding transcriptional ArsR family regulator